MFAKLKNEYVDGGINIFINPFSYNVLRKKNNISSYDCVMVDGQLLVCILRAFGLSNVKRASFDMTSIAPIVFKNIVQESKTIYFIGSKEQVIALFVEKIQKIYPGMKILGFRDGYFDSKSYVDIVESICDLKPDYVVAGMGTPLQEDFLVSLKNRGWEGTGFSCGGFIHQTAAAKGKDYYPAIFNKLHLRWLYRIIDEPKLFKRYFLNYPKAVFLIMKDIVEYKLKNKS